jgi:hypothetical protein
MVNGVQDPYALLGVAPTAPLEEIRRAHRRLARRYHTDAGGPDASDARFKQVQAAYELLSDPVRRAELDRARTAPRPSWTPPRPARPSGRPSSWPPAAPVDLGDLFRAAAAAAAEAVAQAAAEHAAQASARAAAEHARRARVAAVDTAWKPRLVHARRAALVTRWGLGIYAVAGAVVCWQVTLDMLGALILLGGFGAAFVATVGLHVRWLLLRIAARLEHHSASHA